MMEQVRKAPNFSTGLKKAIEEYKIITSSIDDQDKNKFILIQFLEEFYQGFTTDDSYYTSAVHENNFKEALYLAYDIVGNHELLENIYNVDTNLIGDPSSSTH